MTAPLAIADNAAAYAQANPDGPTQASVYDGATADPDISARTLITLAAGETPVIGGRRVDHANATDYGFGALGIEYLLTTSGGALIPDVAGLAMVDVLANDIEQGSGILRGSLAIDAAPTHGAAAAFDGMLYYAPVAGFSEDDDSLTYTVDNILAETSNAATLTISVTDLEAVALLPLRVGILPGITALFDPQGQVAGASLQPPRVLAVEITTEPVNGVATVVGRQVQYTSPADIFGEDTFAWRALINGQWTDPVIVVVVVGQTWRKPGLKKFLRNQITAGPPSVPIAARPDDATTPYGTPITINALANDIGTGISIVSIGAAVSGAVPVDNLDGTITYTPPTNFSGSDSFLYTISDGIRSSTARVSIEVGSPPLIAVTDVASTELTDVVNIAVLGNDVGVDLEITDISDPAHGTAALNGDGVTIDYQADGGFSGTDTFTYEITDGVGNKATGLVRVTVLAAAIAAVNDVTSTPYNTAVEYPVLDNDTGTGLLVASVGSPAHGVAARSSGNTKVTYTPGSTFSGSDSVPYTIQDTYGQQASATLFVTVAPPVGMGPVANPDSGSTTGIAPVEVAVLGNDTGSGIAITGFTQPPTGQGTVTLTSSGTKLTYTAPAGFSGNTSFTYTIANAFGSSTGAVSVTVLRPEMILLGDNVTTPNTTAIDISVLVNDTGTGLTLQSVGGLSPSTAGAVVKKNSTQATFTPAAGFAGTATFTYVALDTSGFTGSQICTVNVTAPPAATYPNGYEQKASTYIGPDSEAMTGFPVLFDFAHPALRTQANGGSVREQYQDIRFEDGAGNKISHFILFHDVVNGRIQGVYKRSRSASAWNAVEVYCGRQAGALDEQDAAGATAGHHFFCRGDTGVDLTGNGRHLTPTSVAAATLFGYPAGRFNGSASKLELANPSAWLNGTSAFTLLLDLQHDQIAVDQGFFRIGGTVNGSDGSCYLMARSDASLLADPTKSALYFAKQDTSIAAVTTNCSVNGQASRIQTGKPSCFAMAWTSGAAQEFFSDDLAETEIAKSVATPTGTLVIPGGPMAFGYGPRLPWAGTMGLVRMASSRRSDAWIRAEQRNRLNPLVMIAAGAFRAPAATAPCVAFPDTATANGSTATIDISPLANDTGTGLSILSVGTPTSGAAVKQTATTIRYTQNLSFSGIAYIPYTIQDSLGRQSSSVVAVTVTPPAITAVDDAYTVTKSMITDLSVLANDGPAGLIEVDAITVQGTLGTATVSADKTKVTYSAGGTTGTDTVTYRIKMIDGVSTDTATITITVQNPSSIPANLYTPPHRPVLESDIVVWNYGDSRPANNWNKYCLLVWPTTPLTGSGVTWNISDAEWAGIFEIGYEYHPIGNVAMYRHAGSSPNWTRQDPALYGMIGQLQRSFNNNAPSSLKQPNKRPFWWADGGRLNSCSRAGDSPGVQQSCWWGDFWKSGIKRNSAGTYASWASDAYIMRTRIDNGYYFFSAYSSPTVELQDPHSDWMQNEALCLRQLNVWRFSGKCSGQGWYLTGDQSFDAATGLPKGIIPSDAWSEYAYMHCQPMPYGATSLFSGSHDLKYIATTQVRSVNASDAQLNYTGNGTVGFHVPPGRFYPVALGPECYFQQKLGTLAAQAPLLGKPTGYPAAGQQGVRISGNRISYGYDERCKVHVPPYHSYPVAGMTSGGPFARAAGYFGDASILAPSYEMVPDSYCGTGRRIATAAELLSYLDNGT